MRVDISIRRVRTHELYAQMCLAALEEAVSKQTITNKVVYASIMNFMTRDYERMYYEESVRYDFEIHSIMCFIGELTPREFMGLFPVSKFYYKSEDWKNYFTVMEIVKENGIDNKIEKPFEFMMEYLNNNVNRFMVQVMNVMSQRHRFEKGKHINEDFYKSLGVNFENERFLLVKETAVRNTFLDTENNKLEKVNKNNHLKLWRENNEKYN